jgi:hypothetical protein
MAKPDAKDRVIREQSRLLKYIVEHSSLKTVLPDGFVLDAERVLVEAKVLLADRCPICGSHYAPLARCACGKNPPVDGGKYEKLLKIARDLHDEATEEGLHIGGPNCCEGWKLITSQSDRGTAK